MAPTTEEGPLFVATMAFQNPDPGSSRMLVQVVFEVLFEVAFEVAFKVAFKV